MNVAPRHLVALLAAACLLVSGCSSLPDDGPVRRVDSVDGAAAPEPPYFQPPGPRAGDTREGIVRGFLTAMEANPISIRTARSFLTASAAESWQPSRRTLIYQASTLKVTQSDVGVRLSGLASIGARGVWQSDGVATQDLSFGLVREKGQWRIDAPPDALIVGAAFFRSTFAPYKVYFYDATGTVLVPRIVHLPRGEETATNLVRALLAGPGAGLQDVATSAFAASTELDLAVTVTRSGVAEVPVSSGVLNMSAREVERALYQLSWTLRSVPGIDRVEMTAGSVPVPMGDGRTGMAIDGGAQFAAYGLGTTRTAAGIQSGRAVTVDGTSVEPVTGPFGGRGFELRSLAQDRAAATIVAVSEDGTRAYRAPLSGSDAALRIATGADLARPLIDRHGGVWLLDRTSSGARILLSQGEAVREVKVPGVTGKQISQIAMSPDGVRLAALVAGTGQPRVTLARVVRNGGGKVNRVLAGDTLSVAEAAVVSDPGPGIDIGWLDDGSLGVLTRPTRSSSRLTTMLVDGSSGESVSTLDDLNVVGTQLLSGPSPDLPLGVLDARGNLRMADSAGKWQSPGRQKYTAIAYAQ